MKIHIIILGIALILGKSYGVDGSPYYEQVTGVISRHYIPLNIGGIFFILLLIALAVLINRSSILGIIRILNKLVMEISIFVISLVSFGSLYFAVWLGRNIWPDFLPVMALPVIGVLASSCCINIIDFNQPVKPGVVNSIVVGVVSFFAVNVILV